MSNNFNPLRKVLYYFIYPACMYFSLSIFAVTALVYITMNPAWAPSFIAMTGIWIFSLIMAALGNIFRYKKINMFFKILIHYLGTVFSFIGIFLVFIADYDNSAGAFLIVVVFSVIYFFTASVILLIRGIVKRSSEQKGKYKKQFN